MITFTTTILQFGQNADKTGWTYVIIPADIAEQLKPGHRRSFRVKGKLDKFPIKNVAIMPHGGGSFLLAINEAMRKGTGKRKGAMLQIQLQEDKTKPKLSSELLECLADEPAALAFFNTLSPSHQSYFSKWIEDAKTEVTKTRRLVQTITALSRKMNYSELIRSQQANKEKRQE